MVKTKNPENSHGNRYKPLPEPIRLLVDKDSDFSWQGGDGDHETDRN